MRRRTFLTACLLSLSALSSVIGALPDYTYFEAGTTITYTSSGGDKAMSLTSLANGSAQESAKSATLVDGTKGMPAFLEIYAVIKPNVAPTDASTIDIYIAESDSATAGTNNPGGLSGTDTAVTGTDAQVVRQLNYAGALVMSNAIGANPQAQRLPRYYVTCPYFFPVVMNSCGQTLTATGTDHKLVITPYYRKIAD